MLIHCNGIIDEDHVLYGMKSDDELVSRKRKLVKLGNDNVDSKKEEEEAVMEVTKSSDDPLKKENEEEDMRNFKLVTILSCVVYSQHYLWHV